MDYNEIISKLESKISRAEKQFKHSKSLAWEFKIENLKKKLEQYYKKAKLNEKKHSKKIKQQLSYTDNVSSTICNFSDISFSNFLFQNITTLNFKRPTIIQQKSIKPFLDGKDLVISSRTGTGKTLAFLIPLVESMSRLTHNHLQSSLILLPTRELAIQVYSELKKLLVGSCLKCGLVKGGCKRTAEFEREISDSHIIVATPGRLVDHLQNSSQNNQTFSLKNVHFLVIDEADILLDQGHLDKLQLILRALPRNRQSVLVSATLNKASLQLVEIALKKNSILINEVKEETGNSQFPIDIDTFNTVEELTQGFVVCPTDRRFCCLYSFLKVHRDKKTMVFMAARDEVTFYTKILQHLGLAVLNICGSMSQVQRNHALVEFTNSGAATLLCTSIAARGLDIPRVQCVIQYDPPQDVKEYIHRVGRTARAGHNGHALLMLKPHETGFLHELEINGVHLSQYEFDFSRVPDIRNDLAVMLMDNRHLTNLAKSAYASVLRGYASADNPECFDLKQLNESQLAKCFGLNEVPKVHIQVKNRFEDRMTWSNVANQRSKHQFNRKKGRFRTS